MPDYYTVGDVIPYDQSHVFVPATSAEILLSAHKNGLNSLHLYQTVCALLNLNMESTISFGISDSRIVIGIQLTRVQRDDVRLSWDRISSHKIFPRLIHKHAAVYFVPVHSSRTVKRIEDTFVIEVRLKPQVDVLYSLKESQERCFIRQSGVDVEMTPEDVRNLAVYRKMNVYSGQIQGLLSDIAKLKAKATNNNDKI